MIHRSQGKVIACFFLIYSERYFLTFDYFSIDDNNNLIKHKNFISDHFYYYNISCIKSSVTPDKSKALVVLYLNNGEARHFIFDINVNYNELQSYYFEDYQCRKEYHGLKVNYYEDTEEFIFTFINDNGKILLLNPF